MMNLRKKVFLAFMGFIIIPLLSISIFTYMIFQDITQEKYMEQSELTIKSIGRNIASLFKEANYYSDYWMLGDNLQTQLVELNENPPSDEQLNNVTNSLRKIFLTYEPLGTFSVYNLYGENYSSGVIPFTPIPFKTLKDHPIYEEVKNLNGFPRWIGPYENPELTGDNNLFSQVRTVNYYETPGSGRIGTMFLQFDFKEMDKIFNFYNQKNSHFLLVNQQGVILYDNRKLTNGSNLNKFLSQKVDLTETYATSRVKFDGIESLVTVYDIGLEKYGTPKWALVSVTPWDYISGEMSIILKWVGTIMFLFLISALLFNLLFVNRYIRAIIRIVSSMKQVERGDLDVRVKVQGNDEMTVLSRGFNSLVSRIHDLVEEVKQEQEHKNKAELSLLQAQIKPHFLFNTLESINALAVQNQGKKVSQLVYRLGTILRISFHHKEEIALGLEIDYLKNYMEIQKYRFEELFDFEIHLPRELENHSILKLTLQPLVENSIQHGFEGITYQGIITIRVEDGGDHIILWVEDNGIGIPEDVLVRFQYRKKNPRLDTNEPRVGLGVLNVADRLRIHYGNGYGLYICSEPNKGTRIKCIIPKTTAR
ncbi:MULTISPECIES: cache domain-containing sensor histidine kinase [Paenibacillus]|nr:MULTISPECIES: sensor histidine kinase [Paenibacillus]